MVNACFKKRVQKLSVYSRTVPLLLPHVVVEEVLRYFTYVKEAIRQCRNILIQVQSFTLKMLLK